MPLQRGPKLPYTVVAGATPWARRWVVASAKLTGSVFSPEPPQLYTSFQAILDEHPAYAVIVVNAPIGFADRVDEGFRRCDREARALLGRRAITIGRSPTRATVSEQGNASNDRLDAITATRLPMMIEVAAEMSSYRQRQVYGGHPELSFYFLNRERPLLYSKTHAMGRDERRDVLVERVTGIEKITDADVAPTKHLLDAAALLYSARRIFLRSAERLPMEAEWDSEGLRMELVY